MNNLDRQYKELLLQIIHFGVDKKDRTGTGTKSIFGWQIRHNMKEGFPLLTTKKMAWKTIVTELLWFLRGDTNIKYLVDNGCHIWDGDAYKNYCKKVIRDKDILNYLKSYSQDTDGVPTIELYSKEEFINKIKTDERWANSWGDLGPIYGKQWREWEIYNNDDGPPWRDVDQIANLISELKTNPDSRRLMVNAWNVAKLDHMVLPPCHYGFQVYTRELSIKERIELWEKIPTRNVMDFPIGELTEEQYHEVLDKIGVQRRAISLMWNQRSVDTFLGLPFNIASYGLLLEIIAKEVNMIPEELIGNLGDVHLYNNHLEQAAEQCSRHPYELPKLKINFDVVHKDWECLPPYNVSDFTIENYQSHTAIKAPLSN